MKLTLLAVDLGTDSHAVVIHGSGLVWNDNAGFGVCSQINEAVKVGGWLC